MTKDEALKLAQETLEANRQTHHYCEDTWYSCPKHEDGCANEFEGDECNCGADKANLEIDYASTAIKKALAQPEQLDLVREMRDVQGQHGNWNYDPYMQGLYNGLEFAVSLLERREPQFKDAPETWIGDIKVKRDRFNSTEPMASAQSTGGEA